MGKADATEGILKRVAEIYKGSAEAGAGPGLCERAADPHLGLEIHRPRRRITVMMIGNHVSERSAPPSIPILPSRPAGARASSLGLPRLPRPAFGLFPGARPPPPVAFPTAAPSPLWRGLALADSC